MTMAEQSVQPTGDVSEAQKDFTTLTGMLEATHAKFKELKQLAQTQLTKKMAALTKLKNEELALKRQMVWFLDERLLQKGLTQKQREMAVVVLCEQAQALLGTQFEEGIQAVLDRHVDPAEDVEDMQALFESLEAELAAEQQANADARETAKSNFKSTKKLGKPSSQPPHPAATSDFEQTLKTIYRKLSSALHPDRERHPLLREKKSKLMVQANKAYADKDLFKLLKLQIKAQPFAPHMADIASEHLRHINQMLRQQLSDALGETRNIEHHIRDAFGLKYGAVINVQTLGRALKQDVEAFINDLRTMQQDMQLMQASDQYLKQWLKGLARGRFPY